MSKSAVPVKLVTVGDAECGKTNLQVIFSAGMSQWPKEYVPTVFDHYKAHVEVNKETIELELWNTGGYNLYAICMTFIYTSIKNNQIN